jgi:hypothetical protein
VDIHSLKVAGVEFGYEKGLQDAAIETANEIRFVHPQLWKQLEGSKIVLVKQEYKMNGECARQFGLKEFKAGAVASFNGDVIVFGGRVAGKDLIAHECAHQLASNLFGTPAPPSNETISSGPGKGKKTSFADRKYGGGSKVENAVTDYGRHNTSEDFAEFVAAYNQIYHAKRARSYRGATKETLEARPETLKTVKILLGDN